MECILGVVYEHFEMCHVGEGKNCGVVEEVKQRDVEVVSPHGVNGRRCM